jgi:hypothetical protein
MFDDPLNMVSDRTVENACSAVPGLGEALVVAKAPEVEAPEQDRNEKFDHKPSFQPEMGMGGPKFGR